MAPSDGDTAARTHLLSELDLLNSPAGAEFDGITDMAAALCDTPISVISLLADDRQWFKARTGMETPETPLGMAICRFTIAQDDVLEIADTRLDERTRGNPLVTGPNGLRFYAGTPLRIRGIAIGTLCVMDRRPRKLTELQLASLRHLGRQVVREIELRQALADQAEMQREIDHRVKNSLQMVMAFLRLQQRRLTSPEASQALQAAGQRVAAISMLHEALHDGTGDRQLDVAIFVSRILDYLRQNLPESVQIDHHLAPATIEAGRAGALGQIVNEFVTNSVKHAFPNGRRGRIRVIGMTNGSYYRLTMSDNGVGYGETADRGLGLDLISTATSQLEAEAEASTDAPGVSFSLTFLLAAEERSNGARAAG